MGSPNNVDIATGEAKILKCREISTKDWCAILGRTLKRIEPRLKYLADFKTLGQLLNSRGRDNGLHFLARDARLITPPEAMPKLDGTCFKQKTRFIIAQEMKLKPDTSAKASHEVKRSFLLLGDGGNFVVLNMASFKQGHNVVVCGSSLLPNSVAGPFSLEETTISDFIADGSISPYNVLDRIYLLFHGTVDDRESRLKQMRQDLAWLEAMLGRIAL